MRLLTIGALMIMCTVAQANLLQNPGFELPAGEGAVPHWELSQAAAQQKIWADDVDPRSGRQCLAVRSLLDTEPSPSVISQRVPVEPNSTYALTLWAKRDSFVYGTQFQVMLLKDGQPVAHQETQVRSMTWVPVAITFDTGQATEAEVRLITPNKGDWRITVGRTLYVDDVSLVRVSGDNDLIIEGSGAQAAAEVTARQAGAYYLWARVRCAGPNTLTLKTPGRSWDFHAYTPGESYWLRPVLPELMLEEGPQRIEVSGRGEGLAVERVILTMDPFSQPEGAPEFLPPEQARDARLQAGFEPVARKSVTLRVAGEMPPGRWGIAQGIPFAAGELSGPEHVRLTDRPCDADVLMRWPDGSVKWLLLKTHARAGEQMNLEYGEQVSPAPHSGPAVTVRQAPDAISLDSGALSLQVPLDGSALISEIKRTDGPRQIARIVGVVNGEYLTSNAEPIVTLEEEGPGRAVVRIAGVHSNAAGEKLLDYVVRVTLWAGADHLEIEHSFILRDDIISVDIEDLSLRLETRSGRAELTPGAEPLQCDLAAGPVTLQADVAGVEGKACDYPYRVTQAAATVAEGVMAEGRLTLTDPGTLRVAVRELWQNAPKRIVAAADHLDLGLVGGPLAFYKGMAKTHDIVLCLGESPTPAEQFAERPLLLAPTDYYCDTRAFGAWPLPAGEGAWPGYESGVEITLRDWHKRASDAMLRPGSGGMIHYGDAVYGGGGNNLETALGEGGMVQFLRTGRREYFDFAERGIRHFADIDIDHSDSSGGLIYAHGPHSRDKLDPERAGINGHSWYNGTIYYALFTGSRRILETAPRVGEYYTRWPFPLQPYIHYWRQIAWKLMDLMQAYDVTGEVRFLQAALEDMEVTRYQRDHLVTLWPYMFAVGMKGARHYYDSTGDPAARELYLQLMDGFMHLRDRPEDTVNGEWPKAEGMLLGNFPNDRSCCFYSEGAQATWLSGDERFARRAGEDLNWQIAFGVTDPTLLWGSADLLRAMEQLGMSEPDLSAKLPGVFMTPGGDDWPGAGLPLPSIAFQVREQQDRDFAVMLFKTSYRKYTHDYHGTAKLYAPDGKLLGEQPVQTSGLRRYRFEVPADGQTGHYTIIITLDDPWMWTLDQLDFELTAGRHVLKINTRYDREFVDAVCLAPAGSYFPTLQGDPPAGAMILQAEEGNLPEGAIIVPSPTALGGTAVRCLGGEKAGWIEFPLDIAQAGTYRFFARAWKGYADLINVTVDDQEPKLCKQDHDMESNPYPAWALATTLGEQAVVPVWVLGKYNLGTFDPAQLTDTPAFD